MSQRRANTFFMIVQRKVLKAAEVFVTDREALESRKEHEPEDSAMDLAAAMRCETRKQLNSQLSLNFRTDHAKERAKDKVLSVNVGWQLGERAGAQRP